MNFEDVEEVDGQSVLLYGRSKAGKTWLAATLANHGFKLIWVDLERGRETIRKAVPRENWNRITYIGIPDTANNPIACVTVGKMLTSKIPVEICHKHGAVACPTCKATKGGTTTVDIQSLGSDTVVVVDSGTQLSDSALAYTMKAEIANIFSKHEKADWDGYGHQGMMLTAIFSAWQQLRCHRILITHEEVIPQSDGTSLIMPKCGTKNYSRNFGRFFDTVAYLYQANGAHKAASGSTFHPKYLTGSRSAVMLERGSTIADIVRGGNSKLNAEILDKQAKSGQTADSQELSS